MKNQIKSSEYLIDPETCEAATLFGIPGDDQEKTYLKAREQIRNQYSSLNLSSYGVETEEIWVDNLFDYSKVRLLVTKPRTLTKERRPLFYDIHGGGMVMGVPEMDFEQMAELSLHHNFVCVAPDYRLAPEHQQPAQLHDNYSGLKWCVEHAEELQIDTEKIAVSGASAGAGLAGGLALYVRDSGKFQIRHLRLAFPMLDDRTGVREPHPFNGQYVYNRAGDYFGWKSVLGQEPGTEQISEYYSPARAKSLAGFPSTYICVGSIELFADEALDFAKRLMYDGVLTELHLYPGGHHNAPLVKTAYYTRLNEQQMIHSLKRALKLTES